MLRYMDSLNEHHGPFFVVNIANMLSVMGTWNRNINNHTSKKYHP